MATMLFTSKKLGLGTLVATIALATACGGSSGPSDPAPEGPASAEVAAGVGQTAPVSTAVPVAPAVLVKNSRGQPVVGATVRFSVTAGGGTVQNATTTTDATGVATAGRWTLGATVGDNALEATVGTLAPVGFTAVATSPPSQPPPGAYRVEIRYLAPPSPRQQAAVENAVARWQSVITGDLSNIPVNVPAKQCFDTQPAINETIDDVLIYVEFVYIDGPGNVLGSAGPCFIRSDNRLPIIGRLKLDDDDLYMMELNGTIDDVVLHEIGHVLGIGTLWPELNLIIDSGGADPQFTGTDATDAYTGLGGQGPRVPVENTGGVGTRDGHWRESVFGNELMTGWIANTSNPMSTVTITSLNDMGYGADPGAANSYTLGGGSGAAKVSIDLRGREELIKPKYKIDRSGKKMEL